MYLYNWIELLIDYKNQFVGQRIDVLRAQGAGLKQAREQALLIHQ
jgi:hypothetical protein